MERRAFLVGAATAVTGMAARPAASQSPPAAGQPLEASDNEAAGAIAQAIPCRVRSCGRRERIVSGVIEPLPIGPTTVIADNVGFATPSVTYMFVYEERLEYH